MDDSNSSSSSDLRCLAEPRNPRFSQCTIQDARSCTFPCTTIPARRTRPTAPARERRSPALLPLAATLVERAKVAEQAGDQSGGGHHQQDVVIDAHILVAVGRRRELGIEF